MEVGNLGPEAYGAPLENAPEGRSGFSHFCLADLGGGSFERCFIKLPEKQIEVINEITGYILASAANQRVPARAALIWVPIKSLPQPLPHWLKNVNQELWPAWCTSDEGVDSIKLYYSAELRLVKDELKKSKESPFIVAFDDWIANNDRNIENLLRLSEGHYSFIDHGRILDWFDWRENALGPGHESVNKVRLLLGDVADRLTFKSCAAGHAETFDEVYRAARGILVDWWKMVDDDGQGCRNINAFLECRAADKAGMKRRLGVLI